MNALRALPQRHFLLQRSTILSFCAAKTRPLIHLPVDVCCLCISWCSTHVQIFTFYRTLKCLFLVIRIHVLPCEQKMFLLINFFLSMQRNLFFFLGWLSENTPFNLLRENFWLTQTLKRRMHTYTHRQLQAERKRSGRMWSFHSFPFFLRTWDHPSIRLFELMCAYVPIMTSSYDVPNRQRIYDTKENGKCLFWQYIYICSI